MAPTPYLAPKGLFRPIHCSPFALSDPLSSVCRCLNMTRECFFALGPVADSQPARVQRQLSDHQRLSTRRRRHQRRQRQTNITHIRPYARSARPPTEQVDRPRTFARSGSSSSDFYLPPRRSSPAPGIPPPASGPSTPRCVPTS